MGANFSRGDIIEISSFHPKLDGRKGEVISLVTRESEKYVRIQLIELNGKTGGTYHIPARCLLRSEAKIAMKV